MISLKMNENSYGPSPKAIEAGIKEIECAWKYPMGAKDLYAALAEFYELAPENFAIGNGLTSTIDALGTAFIKNKENVVFCAPTFMEYKRVATLQGGECQILALDENLASDLTAIKNAVNDETGLILICNPNNPTGAFHKKEALIQFIQDMPKDIIIVIDEAYIEFADDPECETMIPVIKEHENVIVLRTFSKMYGLANLRLGYVIGQPQVIAAIREAVAFFPVSGAAIAMAIEALKDKEYYAEVKKKLIAEKKYVAAGLQEAGCEVYPSQNNFLYFKTNKDDKKVAEKMREYGVDIADRFEHLRVTIGLPKENKAFVEAVTKAMQEA